MILLQLDRLMVDSLSVVNDLLSSPVCECSPIVVSGPSVMDTILAIAMAVIALANICLTFFIFRQGRKDTSESANKQRKFELVQSLILNNRLPLLYSFYDAVSNECRKLLVKNDQQTKLAVNETNMALLKRFRQDFVMPFNVVDHELFVSLKETADDLIDGITEAIFDEGINLKHEPKYNEMITEPLSRNRNAMLSKLYEMANLDRKA